ncbi:MAG: hypothetical protein WCF93_00240 [Candidatus Moraniibacteriota bacterium]
MTKTTTRFDKEPVLSLTFSAFPAKNASKEMIISSIFLGGIMDNIKYFFGVLVVLIFVWLKYKKLEPVEKVLFNLCIDVKCDNKKIEDEQYF